MVIVIPVLTRNLKEILNQVQDDTLSLNTLFDCNLVLDSSFPLITNL